MQRIRTTVGELLIAAFIGALVLFRADHQLGKGWSVGKPLHYASALGGVPTAWQPPKKRDPREGRDEAKPARTAEEHRQAAEYHRKRARHHVVLARSYRSAATEQRDRISEFYRRLAETHQQLAKQHETAARVHSSLARELGEENHNRQPVMGDTHSRLLRQS